MAGQFLCFDFSTYTWSRLTTTGTSPPNQTYVDGIAIWEDTFMYAFVQPYDAPHAAALVYRLDLQKKRWSKVSIQCLSEPFSRVFGEL